MSDKFCVNCKFCYVVNLKTDEAYCTNSKTGFSLVTGTSKVMSAFAVRNTSVLCSKAANWFEPKENSKHEGEL